MAGAYPATCACVRGTVEDNSENMRCYIEFFAETAYCPDIPFSARAIVTTTAFLFRLLYASSGENDTEVKLSNRNNVSFVRSLAILLRT